MNVGAAQPARATPGSAGAGARDGLEGGGFGVGAPFGAEGAADLAEGGFGAGGVQHGRDQVRVGARGGDQGGQGRVNGSLVTFGAAGGEQLDLLALDLGADPEDLQRLGHGA